MKDKTFSSEEKDTALLKRWGVLLLVIVLTTIIVAFFWLSRKPAVELDLQNLSTVVDR